MTSSGTLTVNPARLIVKAHDVSRSFGTPNPPSLGWDLVREDAPETLISAADPDPGLTGSPRPVHPGRHHEQGGDLCDHVATPGTMKIANANYILDLANFQPGTFTITQATLVITANPASRLYGSLGPRRSPTRSPGSSWGRPWPTSDLTGAPTLPDVGR